MAKMNVSARETAYQLIRSRIINLELAPGQPLNDQQLMEEMEMSRTPVREAIIMLSLANLVVVKPQSGTFVAPIDMEQVELEQVARNALEKEMLRRVCQKNKNEEYRALYMENVYLQEFYSKVQRSDSRDKMLEVDNAFHRIPFVIGEMEKHFDHMYSNLHHIERLRTLTNRMVLDKHIWEDHKNIADAVAAQDLAEAERWLDIHMNRYKEHLEAAKRERPDYFKIG